MLSSITSQPQVHDILIYPESIGYTSATDLLRNDSVDTRYMLATTNGRESASNPEIVFGTFFQGSSFHPVT